MAKLAGLRVAITDGAQGIGRAIAEALIPGDVRIVLGDVQEAALKQTAAELNATGYHLDVMDPASFEKFLDRATAHLGGLDVLVNNAGIMPIGPFLQEDPNLTRPTIEIDLMGVMIGTRLAGARFARRGSGHVINIASVMGTLASPNAATYGAAKHAVVGFSSALRQEWRGTGVKISAICPGFVRTELIAGMSAPGLLERFLVVNPEDVADAVVKEIRKGASRTVFVPKTVGVISRGSAPIPASLVDAVFRMSGGNKVTAELDQAERAAMSGPRVELTGLRGVPETTLSETLLATLPDNLASAPWECRCSALLWLGRGGRAAAAALPPALAGRAALATVGGFVRYTNTPVGQYDEVLGMVGSHTGLCPWGNLAFMSVDSRPSLVGGRTNWAMPKTLARFDGELAANSTVTGTGADEISWSVSATPRVLGPAIPLKTKATARQQFSDGRIGDSLLTFSGRVRLAILTVEVSSSGTLQTWLRPGRHLGAFIEEAVFTLGEPHFS